MTQPFDFSAALHALKDGKRLTRRGWHGAGQAIRLSDGDGELAGYDRHIVFEWPTHGANYPQRSRVPWTASAADLLAVDWEIVE